VPQPRFSDADVDAAIAALSDPERFRLAEARVAELAPQLQGILARALEEGGWFGEAHESQVLKAATTPGEDERVAAVRTLIAEETRVGMMVGVAVGWELGRELEPRRSSEDAEHRPDGGATRREPSEPLEEESSGDERAADTAARRGPGEAP
jgi:hypothetical protein